MNNGRTAMEQQTLNFYNAIIATSINVPITFTLDGSILDFPNETDRGKETHTCTVHNARETTKAPHWLMKVFNFSITILNFMRFLMKRNWKTM